MAEQGIVSFLIDTERTTPTLIDDAWTKDLDDLSPKQKLFVRAEISPNSKTDMIDVQAYKRAFSIWHKNGHEVIPSLHGGMVHPYVGKGPTWSPNAPLNVGTDMDAFSNTFIVTYANTVVDFLQGLGEQCPERVWLWNEPNLASLLAIGDNCPPNNTKKPSSLAPEVFLGLVFYTARAIRNAVPAVKHIWPGPLSCLAQYATDPNGPWVGQYLRQGLDYLAKNGVDFATLPFGGLFVNLEGIVDTTYAQTVATNLRGICQDYGLTNTVGVGEWGVGKARWTSAAAMQETFTGINASFDLMCLFQHPQYRDYGLTSWGATAGSFIVKKHEPTFEWVKSYMAGI